MKQADYVRIQKFVIKPMEANYGKYSVDAMQIIMEEMVIYDDYVLNEATRNIIRNIKQFPKVAHLIEECNEIKKRGRLRSSGQIMTGKQPWQDNEDAIDKRRDDYVEQFRSTKIWVEAVNEGWDADLRRYVYHVAWVQSQIMGDSKNIGWNGFEIFGSHPVTPDMKREFFGQQRRQAETGIIEVSIPTGKIEEWKGHAVWMRENALRASSARQRVVLPPMQRPSGLLSAPNPPSPENN